MLNHIVEKRRAYRSLAPVEISLEDIRELVEVAKLAPSCFNKQPWRFVFVKDREILKKLFETLSRGNEWVRNASMLIAVFTSPELDCRVGNREYAFFDTGMSVAFLLLKATEMGLVAHPIAGYDEEKAKQVLKIPDEMTLITLIVVGAHSPRIWEELSERQKKDEVSRPERLPIEKFCYIDQYPGGP